MKVLPPFDEFFAFLSKVSLSTSSFQDKMAKKSAKEISNNLCSILDKFNAYIVFIGI